MKLLRPEDALMKKRIEELSAKPPEELTITEWQDIVAYWKKEAERWHKNADYWQSMASLHGAAALLGLAGQLRGGMKLKRRPGRPRKLNVRPMLGMLSFAEPDRRERKPPGRPRLLTPDQEQILVKGVEEARQIVAGQTDRPVTDKKAIDWIFEHELGITSAHERRPEVDRWRKVVSRCRGRSKYQSQNSPEK